MDLSLATTEQLLDALAARTEGLVVAYQLPHETSRVPGDGYVCFNFLGCGLTLAIGLATRLRAELVSSALTARSADDDDGD